jgi:hypothetical protein
MGNILGDFFTNPSGHPAREGNEQSRETSQIKISGEVRVTRLGEFSPNMRFFTLAILLKITIVVALFVLRFP